MTIEFTEAERITLWHHDFVPRCDNWWHDAGCKTYVGPQGPLAYHVVFKYPCTPEGKVVHSFLCQACWDQVTESKAKTIVCGVCEDRHSGPLSSYVQELHSV